MDNQKRFLFTQMYLEWDGPEVDYEADWKGFFSPTRFIGLLYHNRCFRCDYKKAVISNSPCGCVMWCPDCANLADRVLADKGIQICPFCRREFNATGVWLRNGWLEGYCIKPSKNKQSKKHAAKAKGRLWKQEARMVREELVASEMAFLTTKKNNI